MEPCKRRGIGPRAKEEDISIFVRDFIVHGALKIMKDSPANAHAEDVSITSERNFSFSVQPFREKEFRFPDSFFFKQTSESSQGGWFLALLYTPPIAQYLTQSLIVKGNFRRDL